MTTADQQARLDAAMGAPLPHCTGGSCRQAFGGKRNSFPRGADHPLFQDLTGQRFGRWLVLRKSEQTTSAARRVSWECLCDCGNAKVVMAKSLRNGDSTSCGCRCREVARAAGDRTRTHGMVNTSTYHIWSGMVQRCHNPAAKDYHRYGAKGITVCDRWRTFDNFLADMGERPAGLTLDRKEGTKGYCQDNCRWATYGEQVRNSSAARMVTLSGQTKCIIDWCTELGLCPGTFQSRRQRGWSVEQALTTPTDQRYNWRKGAAHAMPV